MRHGFSLELKKYIKFDFVFLLDTSQFFICLQIQNNCSKFINISIIKITQNNFFENKLVIQL